MRVEGFSKDIDGSEKGLVWYALLGAVGILHRSSNKCISGSCSITLAGPYRMKNVSPDPPPECKRLLLGVRGVESC
jgi:hypothetical protein